MAILITSIILISIIFSNILMGSKREDIVIDRMTDLVGDYEEMQTLLLMSEFFGEEATCLALESMLSSMNNELWDLGRKIDAYRQATEQFMKDPFYIQQKTRFNRKEVLYFSMLKKMKEMCEVNQTIVSFFYRKKEYCQDCDAQSFVLTDIRKELEKKGKEQELALFSFDADLDLPSVSLLIKFYNVSSYPCMVINNNAYCSLYDKKQLVTILCRERKLSICG